MSKDWFLPTVTTAMKKRVKYKTVTVTINKVHKSTTHSHKCMMPIHLSLLWPQYFVGIF